MRTYQFGEYIGFNKKYTPSEMELVTIVLLEGEPYIYVMDDTREARNELVRYLSDMEWDPVIVGMYRRIENNNEK